MSQALYRKWRPARFDQVVGQEHVTRTLKNAVAAGRIGHAYLFSGPRGTGKTTLARLLAKAANCLEEVLAERPCNACAPCLAVNEGRFLDLIEIDAASHTGVDDIRDLRDKINFAPSEGRYKVYIVDEVHMLSMAAFNALLKTLEEPPAHAMFVLATTEEHKVPLTIRSRCQLFRFRLLTPGEIVGRLNWLAEEERLTVEPEAVTMIAQHASGSLRDAESLLDQLVAAPLDSITLERAQMVLGTASGKSVTDLTEAILTGDGPGGLRVIHQALASGADARQFARQMVVYLRQLLLVRTAGSDLSLELNSDRLAEISRQTMQAEHPQLIEAVKRFNEAATTQTGGWQPQLPLELAFIELLPKQVDKRLKTVPSPTEESDQPSGPIHATAAAAPPGEERPEAAQAEPVQQLEPPEGPAEPAPATPSLSLERVTANWPKMRERIGQQDKNLPALLASSRPLAAEGDVLILGFDFPILKDKFDRREGARETVSAAISELLGIACRVQTVISEQYTPAPQSAAVDREELAALAEELGGYLRES